MNGAPDHPPNPAEMRPPEIPSTSLGDTATAEVRADLSATRDEARGLVGCEVTPHGTSVLRSSSPAPEARRPLSSCGTERSGPAAGASAHVRGPSPWLSAPRLGAHEETEVVPPRHPRDEALHLCSAAQTTRRRRTCPGGVIQRRGSPATRTPTPPPPATARDAATHGCRWRPWGQSATPVLGCTQPT